VIDITRFLATRALALLVVGASLVAAPPAHAADAKGYTCTFTVGTAQVYGNGVFKAEPASPLSLEIGDINVGAQTAVQVGATGTVPLKIVRAVNALHFIEVVSEGFLNLTTIYDRDDNKGANPAVQSRHFGILGEPVVSQYQGYCQAK
jgi:hypothetical protein